MNLWVRLVEVVDLLDREVDLSPSRWVTPEISEAEAERRQGDIARGIDRLQELRDALAALARPDVLHPAASSWVTVGDLVADGRAEVVRPVPLKAEDRRQSGVRVLRTKDLSGSAAADAFFVAHDNPRFAKRITPSGDIIVSPASGKLMAKVDDVGDHVLAASLQGVRIYGDWLLPGVAAALLEARRNRRFVRGTAYARLDVREVELPVLSQEDAALMATALDSLRSFEAVATEIRDLAVATRESVVDLASAPASLGARGGAADA